MASPRIEYANGMKQQIRSLLDAAQLGDVTVTLDPLDIPSGSRHGVIVISPPDLTFETFTQTVARYELSVIAGPADNLLAAWEKLDAIIEALRVSASAHPLNLDEARGDMFAPQNGSPLPGYTLTIHPETLID